ncbi:MAG: hypothetical protein IJW40_05180 [Clostridia bacterium]|nr:hypothetical protein [Clostridia bacterium]
MKRLLTLTLAILLCLTTFAGCNTPQTPQTPDDTNTPEPPEDVIDDYDNENEIEIGGEQPEAGSEHTNTVGKFVAKDKTYDYQGNNVTILTLENHSEANCTVTIHAKFLNAYGIVLKTETQSFEGFPAGWQNYFVFIPEMKYDTMEYTLDVKQYTGEMYFSSISGYVLGKIYEAKWCVPQALAHGDYEKYSVIASKFDAVEMPKTPYYKRLVSVIFDNTGEIAVIHTQHGSFSCEYGEEGYYNVLVYAPPVLTKEPLDWPEELDGGVTGIVGVRQAEMIE